MTWQHWLGLLQLVYFTVVGLWLTLGGLQGDSSE